MQRRLFQRIDDTLQHRYRLLNRNSAYPRLEHKRLKLGDEFSDRHWNAKFAIWETLEAISKCPGALRGCRISFSSQRSLPPPANFTRLDIKGCAYLPYNNV
jgi:hypothetical protein